MLLSRSRRRHRRRDARPKQQRFRPHSAAYGDSDSGEKLYGDFGARGEVMAISVAVLRSYCTSEALLGSREGRLLLTFLHLLRSLLLEHIR